MMMGGAYVSIIKLLFGPTYKHVCDATIVQMCMYIYIYIVTFPVGENTHYIPPR